MTLLAGLIGLLLLLGPAGDRLLAASLPVQQAVFAGLLPDFAVDRFALVRSGPHQVLATRVHNRRYLVVDQQAVEPGFSFEASTPARTPLLHLALLWAGVVILRLRGQRPSWPAAGAWLACAATMLLVSPALVLAGQNTALIRGSGVLPDLVAAASDLLIQGAGVLLCLVVLGGLARQHEAAAPAAPARR